MDGLCPLSGAVSSDVVALSRENNELILVGGKPNEAEEAHIVDAIGQQLCDEIESQLSAGLVTVHGPDRHLRQTAEDLLHHKNPGAISWARETADGEWGSQPRDES